MNKTTYATKNVEEAKQSLIDTLETIVGVLDNDTKKILVDGKSLDRICQLIEFTCIMQDENFDVDADDIRKAVSISKKYGIKTSELLYVVGVDAGARYFGTAGLRGTLIKHDLRLLEEGLAARTEAGLPMDFQGDIEHWHKLSMIAAGKA